MNDARILQHTLAPFDLVRIGGSSFRFRPPIGPSATRPTEKWAEDPNLALRSLYGFVHALSETVEQSEILDVVVARLLEVFAAAGEATVYLLDRSTQRMIIARSHDRNSIAVASMSDHAATTRAPADGCGLSEARAGA